MIKIKSKQDYKRLRRLALSAQGLLQTKPFGRGIAGAKKAISHIGYVQLDTISVVERAHHHVFYSRVPNFKPDMANKLLNKREIFEYWSHAAAFLPMEDFRFSLLYKQAIKSGQTHWYKNPDKKLMADILARIQSEGPLKSRDLEANPNKRAGWWDWKPAKKAVEQLYMQGDLMVSDREGFQKTYDLTERVLPDNVNTQMPSTKEFANHLIDQQLRCHGLVTLKGITYLRRNSELRKAVKTSIEQRLSDNELELVKLDSGEQFYVQAGGLDARMLSVKERMLILSPFDNSVIQRERLKSLFGYDYQIECYVPEPKRQFGYFCLPLLFRDEFIGRMDCKAHRKNKHLEIKSLHFEKHDFDNEQVIAAFKEAVCEFCRFQNCDTVSLVSVNSKALTEQLQAELNDIAL